VRWALVCFAFGVLLLQEQAELIAVANVAWAAIPFGVALALDRHARHVAGLRSRVTKIIASLCAGLSIAVIGFSYADWRAEQRLADVLPAAWEGRDVTAIGVVDELPQASDEGARFAFAVERIETPEAIVPSRLALAWYSGRHGDDAEKVPTLHAGERWHLTMRLKRPHGTVNPHGFDVEAWLLENDLRATGYVRTDASNRRLDLFAGRPGDYVQRARESIRDRILGVLRDRPYAGVIAALAIGDERAIPAEQWQLFNRTGVGHLISISGLHVTFFATLIGALAFWLWKRGHALTTRIAARKVAAIAGVCAALAYVLLAGFQVPAQRTLYMLMVAATGLWLARPGTASVVWLWALAVVLAIDPWAGLTAGFWLSFGAVGLLLYIGVGRIGIEASWRSALRAQAAITLGLIPLMLILFQQISIVSPLANAVAIPVVTFAVVPLTLASIAVPWDLLLVIAHQVFAWVALLLTWLSGLPAAVWQQHAPSLWATLAGVVGVLWIFAPRGLPGRALGLVWLIPLFIIVPSLPALGAFKVTVLDVGQGLAVLVQTHGHALLYDTGPRYNESADAGNRIVAPMLRATGVAALDTMVVSHQDSDHSGGALSLLQTVPVTTLLSSLPDDHAIARTQRERGGAVRRCAAGQRWTWDGVDFAVLHPIETDYAGAAKTNDLSCVLRVIAPAGSALLTGDIEARSEAALMRRDDTSLHADLMVVPHHGSRTSSTQAFIARVRPQFAAFTPGYRNRFGHPRPEIVERYAAAGVESFRTDYEGALTFVFAEGHTREPRRERLDDLRYWRDLPTRAELTPLD
jgi:competence protein ComEC